VLAEVRVWSDGGVTAADLVEPQRLRRVVLLVAALNASYAVVEMGVALAIGSVSLLADSVDFLEDAAINLLIALALGWPLARRAVAGHVMAGIILVPAVVAAWQAVSKAFDPVAPDATWLVVTAGGAVVVNTVCSLLLVRVRHHGGSLSGAAYLSARNDVVVNVAIIVMALVTAWSGSGWPDILLGAVIVLVNGRAAWEVWELAGEERLAARALAGEDLDD
jgi:Co/Zn/Cd efflux system component